jgi:hypothetical protein
VTVTKNLHIARQFLRPKQIEITEAIKSKLEGGATRS